MDKKDQTALLGALISLHDEADRIVQSITESLKGRINCGPGCADCCRDDLTVFEIEALRIREEFGPVLQSAKPAPDGRCAFLDKEDRCRIYTARPYVCRTQGLPLRWMEEVRGTWVEFRDICPINDKGAAVESLDESDCFTLGPFEQRLRELQEALSQNLSRVKLRELFKAD